LIGGHFPAKEPLRFGRTRHWNFHADEHIFY
jgi:hypothetical protein